MSMGTSWTIMDTSRFYRLHFNIPKVSSYQGVRGLLNYGLCCCANALLQSLSATRELLELLDQWTPTDGVEEARNVPLQLRKALHAMQRDLSKPAPHKDFLDCMDRNSVRLYTQQDADEVFLSILNFIQQQMADEELAEEIQNLFKVTVEGHLQCSECTFAQSVTSYLLSLPLPLNESQNTLEDRISTFFQQQQMMGSDECFCQRCGENQPSTQGFKLLSLPRVLCVHLKRFRSDRGYTRKLHCKVSFPETLNFADILSPEQVAEDYVKVDQQYSLYAVIVHSGSAMFGHYTAYVRHVQDQTWYRADDSSVRQASWDDIIQRTYGGRRMDDTAYMLMYRRRSAEVEQQRSG